MHDLVLENNEFRQNANMQRRTITLIFFGLCGTYFVYFSLLSFTGLVMHFLQVMKINGIISQELSEEKYVALDKEILKWFRQGIYFFTLAAFFFTLQLMTMMNQNFASRRFRHDIYYAVLVICIIVIVIIYYVWAVKGLKLYFGEVRQNIG